MYTLASCSVLVKRNLPLCTHCRCCQLKACSERDKYKGAMHMLANTVNVSQSSMRRRLQAFCAIEFTMETPGAMYGDSPDASDIESISPEINFALKHKEKLHLPSLLSTGACLCWRFWSSLVDFFFGLYLYWGYSLLWRMRRRSASSINGFFSSSLSSRHLYNITNFRNHINKTTSCLTVCWFRHCACQALSHRSVVVVADSTPVKSFTHSTTVCTVN